MRAKQNLLGALPLPSLYRLKEKFQVDTGLLSSSNVLRSWFIVESVGIYLSCNLHFSTGSKANWWQWPCAFWTETILLLKCRGGDSLFSFYVGYRLFFLLNWNYVNQTDWQFNSVRAVNVTKFEKYMSWNCIPHHPPLSFFLTSHKTEYVQFIVFYYGTSQFVVYFITLVKVCLLKSSSFGYHMWVWPWC